MKLIIIEDDYNFATLVARSLQGLVDSVEIVDSWEKAKNIDENEAAWIDLRMPPNFFEANSIANIEELRKRNKKIIIVVGSGFISPETRAKLDRAGVDSVFHKDSGFNAEQVAGLVISAIMRASMRDTEVHRKLLTRALEWMRKRFPTATAQSS